MDEAATALSRRTQYRMFAGAATGGLGGYALALGAGLTNPGTIGFWIGFSALWVFGLLIPIRIVDWWPTFDREDFSAMWSAEARRRALGQLQDGSSGAAGPVACFGVLFILGSLNDHDAFQDAW